MIKRKKITANRVVPVSLCLENALSCLRNRQIPENREISGRYHPPYGKEMILLGKLLYKWSEIIGSDLAAHVKPKRLIRGRLILICSDSQWMQTLIFIKRQIVERIRIFYPEIVINSVVSSIAKLPVELRTCEHVPWPDWTFEPDSDIPSNTSRELYDIMRRCYKKLSARRKALIAEGWKPCRNCRNSLVHEKMQLCFACMNRKKEELTGKLRSILSDTPWLSVDTVKEMEPDADEIVIDSVRSDLYLETRSRINSLISELAFSDDRDLTLTIKFEIIRALILKTGISPDQLEINSPSVIGLLEDGWLKFLPESGGNSADSPGKQ